MFELTRSTNHPMDRYNPFREMEELQRRFFGPSYDDFFRMADLAEFKTDITDEGDSFLLEADLPGFAKEDIHLDLNGNTLTVSAQRHSNVEHKEKDKVVRVERSYGTYRRSYDITGINADGIRASYENGVLKLTLPKKVPLQPAARRIEIQ